MGTIVINNDIGNQGPGPPQFNFCQSMYMCDSGEIKSFCPKSCYLSPSSKSFSEHNAMTRAGFTIWHGARSPRAPIVRLFLAFTYIRQEDVAKISEVPEAPSNVNPAQSTTWLVSVTIYCNKFQ